MQDLFFHLPSFLLHGLRRLHHEQVDAGGDFYGTSGYFKQTIEIWSSPHQNRVEGCIQNGLSRNFTTYET